MSDRGWPRCWMRNTSQGAQMNWEGAAGGFETVLLEDVTCMLVSHRPFLCFQQCVALNRSFAHRRLSLKKQAIAPHQCAACDIRPSLEDTPRSDEIRLGKGWRCHNLMVKPVSCARQITELSEELPRMARSICCGSWLSRAWVGHVERG